MPFDFDGEGLFAELEINPSEVLTLILFNEKGKIISKEFILELSQISTLLKEIEYAYI